MDLIETVRIGDIVVEVFLGVHKTSDTHTCMVGGIHSHENEDYSHFARYERSTHVRVNGSCRIVVNQQGGYVLCSQHAGEPQREEETRSKPITQKETQENNQLLCDMAHPRHRDVTEYRHHENGRVCERVQGIWFIFSLGANDDGESTSASLPETVECETNEDQEQISLSSVSETLQSLLIAHYKIGLELMRLSETLKGMKK